MKLGSVRPPPASSRNLSVAVPVGKRETVKISCGLAEPNSALFREIEINVDEESDVPSVSPAYSGPRASASVSMSVKTRKRKQMKNLKK